MTYPSIPKNLCKQHSKTKVTNFIESYHKHPIVWQNKIAYLSGLIDGEGYLKIEENGTIRIVIGMCDKKTIQWIYNTFGGNITTQKTSKGRTFYVWRMNQGKDLYYLMLLCIPFLITKKEIVTDGFIRLIKKLNKKRQSLGNQLVWGW